MATLILPIGIPGSGKSWWCQNILKSWGIRSVSSDKMREILYGDAAIQGDYQEVFSAVYDVCRYILLEDGICCIDATNVTRHVREKAIRDIEPDEVVYVIMNNNIKKAKQQNLMRSRVVPEHIIDRMYKSFKRDYPCPEKDFIHSNINYHIYNYTDFALAQLIRERVLEQKIYG